MSTTNESAKPWHNESTLREAYNVEGKSLAEIGDEYGVDSTVILYWMDQYDISRRDKTEAANSRNRVEWASYYVSSNEYEYWRDGSTGNSVTVHQLLSCIDNDPHDVFADDTVTHHRTGHSLDNRRENVEVLTRAEHNRTHGANEWTEEDGFPVLVTQRDGEENAEEVRES